MKKFLLLTLFAILAIGVIPAQEIKKQPQKQSAKQTVKKNQPVSGYVYICNGPSATKYHKTSNCRGLSRCSTKIQKILKGDALKKGRSACKICYK